MTGFLAPRRPALAAWLFIAVTASCVSSHPAPSVGHGQGICPNDTAPTSGEVSQCQAFLSDATCGALFQVYYACAARQEQCTDAGTDDGLPTAAIEANCAQQVSAYKTCAAGEGAGSACGDAGQPCCTTGTACDGGCCDPATRTCVMTLHPCSGAGQTCSLDACTTACTYSCKVCGAAGAPCCGTVCTDEGACCDDNASTPGVSVAAPCARPRATRAPPRAWRPPGIQGNCQACGARWRMLSGGGLHGREQRVRRRHGLPALRRDGQRMLHRRHVQRRLDVPGVDVHVSRVGRARARALFT